MSIQADLVDIVHNDAKTDEMDRDARDVLFSSGA